MIRRIKPNDNLDFVDYCLQKQYQTDIKCLQLLFRDTQKHGTECTIYDNKGFQGLLLAITEHDRKYVHLITNTNTIALQLMKQYIWGSTNNLYITFPMWNSLVKPLTRIGFRITSKRGDPSVDLYRKFDRKFYFQKKRIRNYE